MDNHATSLTTEIQKTNNQIFKSWWFLSAVFFTIIACGSFFINPYLAFIATSWIIFGLLGLSLDIVWGHGGFLSLGQTAFYGLGGYAGSIVAINLTDISSNTLLWSILIGGLTGMVTAVMVGWIIFYGRMGTFQSTILTYTLILILWTLGLSFNTKIGNAVVGGDNGMSNIPEFVIGFFGYSKVLEPNGMFLMVVLIAAIIYFISKFLMKSPFGLIINCIRLDFLKTELLGYNIRLYQLLLFTFAGAIAGIAGSLFGAWATYLNPSIFSVQEALLVPIYVLVGGLGTLIGPFIGALLVGGLSFWLGGGIIGGQTTLVMGLCLIFLVIFLKKGLIGGLKDLIALLKYHFVRETDSDSKSEFIVNIDLNKLNHLLTTPSNKSLMILETKEVLKRFGGVTPVNNITQSFKPGKVRCIIGPNGAGKSSFLKICTGTYKLDKGKVILGDKNVTAMNSYKRIKFGLGIKMQTAQVFDELNVQQNLWVAAYSRNHDKKEAQRIAHGMLQLIGMKKKSNCPASELSHGEQQWLDISMVLCLSPKVLLLDEPAAGMTKKEQKQLSELIKNLARENTIVVVDHDMDFIRSLDGEVTVLHQGAVLTQGNIEELRKDHRVLDIYLGR